MNVGEKTGHNQSLLICSSIITAVRRKPPFPYISSALVVCTQVFIQRIGLYTQATDVFRDINGEHKRTGDFICHCWKPMGRSERKVPTGIILVGPWAIAWSPGQVIYLCQLNWDH